MHVGTSLLAAGPLGRPRREQSPDPREALTVDRPPSGTTAGVVIAAVAPGDGWRKGVAVPYLGAYAPK